MAALSLADLLRGFSLTSLFVGVMAVLHTGIHRFLSNFWISSLLYFWWSSFMARACCFDVMFLGSSMSMPWKCLLKILSSSDWKFPHRLRGVAGNGRPHGVHCLFRSVHHWQIFVELGMSLLPHDFYDSVYPSELSCFKEKEWLISKERQ